MKSIEFQIYDYRETHQTFEDDDDSERETMGEYVIQVFGRTMDGKSVYAKLKDFKPRFYLKVPQNWTNRHLKRMEKYLKSKENFQSRLEYDTKTKTYYNKYIINTNIINNLWDNLDYCRNEKLEKYYLKILNKPLQAEYFLKYIKKFSLNIFVFYRVVLGLILIVLVYL